MNSPHCGNFFMPRAKLPALVLLLLAGAALCAPAIAGPNGPALAPIQLTPERQQLIGLKFAVAEEKELKDRIATTALVEPDEQLEGYVQTRFAGWVRQVFVNQTYQYVRRGQPLFTIYSPDLVSAEQEYLLALDATKDLRNSDVEGVASGARSLIEAALERLKLFGVAPREIARLKRDRTAREALEIDSPMSGYVMDWSALPNKYVQPDARLYTIADLSTVWVYAAVYQNQLGEVKVGDPVSVTVDAYPGMTFAGRVDFIWQAIDPVTRTARVRCALPNPGGALKLGMYAAIALEPRLGRALAIPDAGVFRTGTHNIVFIDRGNGYLQPAEVELGPHAGNEFAVRKGLRAGDRIVSSANFLIDSESQLQAAMGTFAPPPPGASANAAQPSLTAPQPAATLEVATDPNPPVRGKSRVRATLKDSHGNGIAGANVTVTFFMAAMPAMGMTAMRAASTLADSGGGVYEGTIDLESGGTWQVTATATKGGQTLAGAQFNVSVSGSMAM